MARKKIKVCLVYRAGLDLWGAITGQPRNLLGSDLLRLQMGKALLPYLPDDIDLSFSHFGGRIKTFDRWLAFQRPAIFILTKLSAYLLTPEQIVRLRKRAILLGVDHKDGNLSDIDLSLFDFHLAASYAGQRALTRILRDNSAPATHIPYVGLLQQSPDARLNGIEFRPLPKFSTMYLGTPKNSLIPPDINDQITTFEVRRQEDMDPVLPRINQFNFHYAVRPSPPGDLMRSYKPFTKGMTAATCHSNIIVNRDVDDAVDLLTHDYPYLVPGNDPSKVTEVFNHARDSFGSPEWNRGLDIMADLRERVSNRALAAQLTDIVREVAQ